MKKLIWLSICIPLVLLTGCASTPADLKVNPAGSDMFETNQPSLPVFLKLLKNVQDTHDGAYTNIRCNYIEDQGNGEISIIGTDGFGLTKNVYFTIEITKLSDSQTRVKSYYLYGTWKRWTKRVREWCET